VFSSTFGGVEAEPRVRRGSGKRKKKKKRRKREFFQAYGPKGGRGKLADEKELGRTGEEEKKEKPLLEARKRKEKKKGGRPAAWF